MPWVTMKGILSMKVGKDIRCTDMLFQQIVDFFEEVDHQVKADNRAEGEAENREKMAQHVAGDDLHIRICGVWEK